MELVGRMVLAVVFGVAGAAKLVDRGGGRRALVAFGVPRPWVGPAAWLIPLAELGVAVSLAVRPWVRFGAMAALGLLVLFSVAAALNLAGGRTPDCHCFGRWLSARLGPATLVRNAALAALSVAVLTPRTAAWSGTAAGVAAATLVVLAVRRRASGPRPRRAAMAAPAGASVVSRRHALGLVAMAVLSTVLLKTPRASACGAECRSSADCPGGCRNCRKQPGVMLGHCH